MMMKTELGVGDREWSVIANKDGNGDGRGRQKVESLKVLTAAC